MDRFTAFTMALAGSLVVTTAHGAGAPATPVRPVADTGFRSTAAARFEIPSQSLQTALERFSAATGWSGLYSADATSGRLSNALSGWYTPDAALRLLMDGSGLAVHYTAADAFVLEPDAQPAADAPQSGTQPVEALLQAGVRQAFCLEPRLASGDYRVAFSLRLGAQGRVQDARLLGSSGSAARDSAVLGALRKVDIGSAAGAAQSFVMLVLPRPPDLRECGALP